MTYFFLVISGLLGAVWASFLATLASRYPHATSRWWHRSRCESCMAPVRALLLTPVASYIALRGACAFCKKLISRIHIGAECVGVIGGVCTGALFLLWQGTHSLSGFTVGTVISFFVLSCFIYGACVDARLNIIPDSVTVGAGTLLVVLSLVLGYSPWFVFGGVAVVSGFLGIQYVLSRGAWIGLGDVKFGVLIGAFLGPWGGFWALVIAYMVGAFYGTALLLTHRARLNTHVPLGVFLALGASVSFMISPMLTSYIMGI